MADSVILLSLLDRSYENETKLPVFRPMVHLPGLQIHLSSSQTHISSLQIPLNAPQIHLSVLQEDFSRKMYMIMRF